MSIFRNFHGDFFGGVTAAIVALPLALAFGVASGAGPLAGLYGAIIAGFFASVFGGTKVQITGPTGPMTVVMALVVTHFSNDPGTAFAVVTLAGVFQILFGIAGVGRYVKLTPQPVVSGFMSGIGVIIIIVQLAPMLGQAGPDGSMLVKLAALPAAAAQLNPAALAIGLITLAIVFFTPRVVTRFVPSPLVALLVGSVATAVLALDVPVIGTVPSGLPHIVLPNIALADVGVIVRFALVLAFLGSIDSLLTSIVVDSMTRTQHDSNRELIGQGIGNAVAGLFGGVPSAGATMRTVVNARAGGKTQVSGVIHAAVLLLIVLGAGSVVQHIPHAVLAGILLKVGIDIIDWKAIGRLQRAPRAGVIIMLITLVLTVFVDLITAVAAGFVMASVLFVARTADAQVSDAKIAFGADDIDDLNDEEQAILERSQGRIVLFHVAGPLSFGSARDIARMLQTDIEKDVLVIDMRDVPFIDSSASFALDEVIMRLAEEGDAVLLFGTRDNVLDTLRRTEVLDRLGPGSVFLDRTAALRHASTIINASTGR